MNTGYFVKSLLVLLYLVLLLFVSFVLIRRCIINRHDGILKKSAVVATIFYILFALLNVVAFGEYVYPFERTLKPIPHGVAVLPEDKALDYPGQKYWHGAYEKYGLYAGSFYFNTEGIPDKYGISWPPMDFKHYSYVITYGQKIDKLTYNVWDTIDFPIRTGAKVGHMTLDEEFSPRMVYIYRIPKLRIENDRSQTSTSEGETSSAIQEQHYSMGDFDLLVPGESTLDDALELYPPNGGTCVTASFDSMFCDYQMQDGRYIRITFSGENSIILAIEEIRSG